jgi:hypothetical protein
MCVIQWLYLPVVNRVAWLTLLPAIHYPLFIGELGLKLQTLSYFSVSPFYFYMLFSCFFPLLIPTPLLSLCLQNTDYPLLPWLFSQGQMERPSNLPCYPAFNISTLNWEIASNLSSKESYRVSSKCKKNNLVCYDHFDFFYKVKRSKN